MRNKNLFRLSSLIAFAMLSISCTRGAEVKTNLRLSVPKIAGKAGAPQSNLAAVPAPGTLILNYVAINVEGKLLFAWEGHDGANAVPDGFDVSVPSGKQRTIQVLALYKPYGQSGQTFYYGDATSDIPAANNLVDVTVAAIGGAATEGRIMGRWVDALDPVQGPTGLVTMKFTPPGGKPAMVVHTSEMFGGLFTLFALNETSAGADSGFNYIGPTGVDLFLPHITPGHLNTNVDAFDLTSAPVYRLKTVIPLHHRVRNDGGATMVEVQPQNTIVFGWFGLLANYSSRQACFYNSGAVAMNDAFQVDDVTPFTWLGAMSQGGGGTNAYDTNDLPICGTDRYIDDLPFDPTEVDNGDGGLALRGPYLNKSQGGGYRQALAAYLTGNSLNIKYEYAPKVITSVRPGIDGSDVLYRVVDANYHGGDDYRTAGSDGADCGQLLRDKVFSFLVNAPAAPAAPAESVTLTINNALRDNFNAGKIQLLACPYQVSAGNKKYFGSVIDFKSYGTPPGPQLATSYDIVHFGSATAPFYMGNNICTPMKLMGKIGAQPAQLPPYQAILINKDDASTHIYSDPTCNVSYIWGSNPPQMTPDGGYLFYVQRDTTSPQLVNLSVSSGSSTGTKALNFLDGPYPGTSVGYGNQGWAVVTPASIFAHQCVPVAVFKRDFGSSGIMTQFDNSTTYSVGFSTQTDQAWYSDPSCTQAGSAYINNIGYSEVLSFATTYYKYTGTSTAPIGVNMTTSTPSVGQANPSVSVAVSLPGAVSKLYIEMPQSIPMGFCQPSGYSLRFVDSMGHDSPVTSPTAIALSLSGSGGEISIPSGGTCSCSSGVSSLTLPSVPAGENITKVCFKNKAPFTPLTLTATAGTLNASLQLVVTPPPATGLLFVFPGETFTEGTSTVGGTVSPIARNQTVLVKVYAVYSNAGLFYTATDYGGAFPLSYGGAYPAAGPGSLTFVNGLATFNIIAPNATSSFNIGIAGGPAPNSWVSSYQNTP